MRFHDFGFNRADLDGTKLVVASVSVGNVPQLAADILVNSLEFSHVGMIISEFATPVIGNSPYESKGDFVSSIDGSVL